MDASVPTITQPITAGSLINFRKCHGAITASPKRYKAEDKNPNTNADGPTSCGWRKTQMIESNTRLFTTSTASTITPNSHTSRCVCFCACASRSKKSVDCIGYDLIRRLIDSMPRPPHFK